jgi:Ca-activated chloride channel homolog
MTGRHSASSRGAKGSHEQTDRFARLARRLWLPALLILVTPVAIFGMVRAQSVTDTGLGCEGEATIEVLAAPSIAPALEDAGTAWADDARPNGVCPTVEVTARSSTEAADELADPEVDPPDLWVPDSTQWVQRVRLDTSGVDTPVHSAWVEPSIASSPIVLAVTPDDAASLVDVSSGGWSEVLSGEAPFAVLDPEKNTDGLLTLATAQETLGSESGTPTRELVSSLVTLSDSVLESTDDGMDRVRSADTLPFPVSEQAVIQANSESGDADVQSVYPQGQGMALDFPVVQFAPPTQEPAHQQTVEAFVSALYEPAFHRELHAIGLRDGDGSAFPDTVDFQGIAPTAIIQSLPQASDQQMTDALRVWLAAQRGNRTLIVVDVSGSMAEEGGDKIRFASDAVADVVVYLPDTAQLGLWAFSTDLNGSLPWRELVPLGTIGSPDDPEARRQDLKAQAEALPELTESAGNTGLYQTTWDSFQSVSKGYDADLYNSVVLMTDGEDTSGQSLSEMLSRLRDARESSRPLPILTIAIGTDADRSTLRRISQATGGVSYSAAAPSEIRDVFLDAVIEAGT